LRPLDALRAVLANQNSTNIHDSARNCLVSLSSPSVVR